MKLPYCAVGMVMMLMIMRRMVMMMMMIVMLIVMIMMMIVIMVMMMVMIMMMMIVMMVMIMMLIMIVVVVLLPFLSGVFLLVRNKTEQDFKHDFVSKLLICILYWISSLINASHVIQICDSSRSHFVIPVRVLNKDGVNLREFSEYGGDALYDACVSRNSHYDHDDHSDRVGVKMHILESMMASHKIINDSIPVSEVDQKIATSHQRPDDHVDANARCDDDDNAVCIKVIRRDDDHVDDHDNDYYDDYDDDGNRLLRPTQTPLPSVQKLHDNIRGMIDEVDRDILDINTEIMMK